jgi:ATP/maltotriose-dependent transcriptional regulator MalT
LADGPIHRTGTTAPGKSSDANEALSKRELEVLSLVAQRLSNKEIAEKLFISPGTVKQHIYKTFQKLNVSKRHEAAEKASLLGII